MNSVVGILFALLGFYQSRIKRRKNLEKYLEKNWNETLIYNSLKVALKKANILQYVSSFSSNTPQSKERQNKAPKEIRSTFKRKSRLRSSFFPFDSSGNFLIGTWHCLDNYTGMVYRIIDSCTYQGTYSTRTLQHG